MPVFAGNGGGGLHLVFASWPNSINPSKERVQVTPCTLFPTNNGYRTYIPQMLEHHENKHLDDRNIWSTPMGNQPLGLAQTAAQTPGGPVTLWLAGATSSSRTGPDLTGKKASWQRC